MENLLYNDDEILVIIIRNIIKMLCRRKIFKEKSIDSMVENAIKMNSEKGEIILKDENEVNHRIKILTETNKISSLKSNPELDKYMNENINDHKIIVINKTALTMKLQNMLLEFNASLDKKYRHLGIEVFEHEYFYADLIESNLIPKHKIIEDQKIVEELLECYKADKLKFPIIFNNDIVARYYNAKPDDFIKITRSSDTTGKTITYRYVIPGSVTD